MVLKLTPLYSNPLANLEELVFCVHAWIDLMQENPIYAKQLLKNTPHRYENIRNNLLELKEAIQHINDVNLFDKLIDRYNTNARLLKPIIDGLEAKPSLDYWGSPDQSISGYIPPPKTLTRCDNNTPLDLVPPDNWQVLFSPKANLYIVAEYLSGMGNVELCVQPKWDFLERTPVGLYGRLIIDISMIFRNPDNSRMKVAARNFISDTFCQNRTTNPFGALKILWQGSFPPSCSGGSQPIVSNLKQKFETQSKAVPLSNQDQQAVDQLNSLLESKIKENFRNQQITFYDDIKTKLSSSTPFHEATQEIAGSKLLLQNYAVFGLAISLYLNDYLRALLFGDQGLLDGQTIKDTYVDTIRALQANTPTTAKVDIEKLALKRSDELRRVLHEILKEGYSEDNPMVELPLRRLEMYYAAAPFIVIEPNYQLTVRKAGDGSGTVTSTPSGINCGDVCAASYPSGAAVTLTATAAEGSTFAGWNGACSGTGPCNVTLDQGRAVTATFSFGVPLPN